MKKIIFIVACLAFQSAQASVMVHCEDNAKKNSFTYYEGKFSYCLTACNAGGEQTFEGQSLKKDTTVMGTMLSVEESVSPDQQQVYVSLLLPDINLDEELPLVDFKTTAITTIAKTSFAGPAGVKGVVQSSKFYQLNCTASLDSVK